MKTRMWRRSRGPGSHKAVHETRPTAVKRCESVGERGAVGVDHRLKTGEQRQERLGEVYFEHGSVRLDTFAGASGKYPLTVESICGKIALCLR